MEKKIVRRTKVNKSTLRYKPKSVGPQTAIKGKAMQMKAINKDQENMVSFEPNPVSEATKGIVDFIEKVTDLENLNAISTVLKRHWKKVHLEACKRAASELKEKDPVWFKKGSKIIQGSVVKVKPNGKVKILADEGKTWRIPGVIVKKGNPNEEETTVATSSEVNEVV
jgi:hypothetical protein